MSSEILCQSAEADAGEEVDGKPGVSGVVPRHQTLPGLSHAGIPGSAARMISLYSRQELELNIAHLSINLFIPINSASSWKRIFINILELDVVSSSFSFITWKGSQPMESVWKRCEKNFPTFLKI